MSEDKARMLAVYELVSVQGNFGLCHLLHNTFLMSGLEIDVFLLQTTIDTFYNLDIC